MGSSTCYIKSLIVSLSKWLIEVLRSKLKQHSSSKYCVVIVLVCTVYTVKYFTKQHVNTNLNNTPSLRKYTCIKTLLIYIKCIEIYVLVILFVKQWYHQHISIWFDERYSQKLILIFYTRTQCVHLKLWNVLGRRCWFGLWINTFSFNDWILRYKHTPVSLFITPKCQLRFSWYTTRHSIAASA